MLPRRDRSGQHARQKAEAPGRVTLYMCGCLLSAPGPKHVLEAAARVARLDRARRCSFSGDTGGCWALAAKACLPAPAGRRLCVLAAALLFPCRDR